MSDNIKKMIGERIGLALKNADKKQKELAQHLNISDNTVSYFVNGSRTPNTEQIIKIADFLNVSADYLLGFSDNLHSEYQDIGFIMGLSDKAIERILDFNDFFGTGDILNFIVESEHFMKLAAVLSTYLGGGWGYRYSPEIESKVTKTTAEKNISENLMLLEKYRSESAYTEFLMAQAIIDVLVDVRKEYQKKCLLWKDELSTTEEDIFNSLVSEVNKLFDEYSQLNRKYNDRHLPAVKEKYDELLKKMEELEEFKLKYAKIADFRERLEKLENAIKNQFDYLKLERGAKNGQHNETE